MMIEPTLKIADHKVFAGHNLDVLKTFADNSIDSIVTDPPYELGFMGKSWDNSGIAYSVELWQECLRVLKPGGHLLAFGGSRTWHRLAVAIEDAGFEVRDSIAWLYGSGFPKSHNISKAIDKLHGAEREVVGSKASRIPGGNTYAQDEWTIKARELREVDVTEPATDDAKKWDGWGTALKPAFEPIVVARKPLVGTVAENVLQFGTGGINVDASRIGNNGGTQGADFGEQSNVYGNGLNGNFGKPVEGLGRWPANVILDETTAKQLDEQSGVSQPSKSKTGRVGGQKGLYKNGHSPEYVATWPADNGGGASRFFYVAKASKRDRNEGLDDLPVGKAGAVYNQRPSGGLNAYLHGEDSQPVQNFHPTVKPTQLMRYLVKLVTPPNGVVLDPFAGSGSTGKAAILEGYTFIGIELTEDYLPIIEGRLEHAYQTYCDKAGELFE